MSSPENLPARISSWFSTAPPTIAAATSHFPTMVRCCSCRPIRRSSTRRRIFGMKSAKKSSRTTPSNPSTQCAPNFRRRSSTSNAIPESFNPSPPSPTSPSHSDVEMVLDEATAYLQHLRGQRQGYLRVGSYTPHRFIGVVARYKRRFPGVSIWVEFANSRVLARKVLNYELDLAVTARE